MLLSLPISALLLALNATSTATPTKVTTTTTVTRPPSNELLKLDDHPSLPDAQPLTDPHDTADAPTINDFNVDDYVTDRNSSGAYFAYLGKMARTTTYAHLRIDMDLRSIRFNITRSCRDVQKVINATKTDEINDGHVWAVCDRLLTDFDNQEAIYLRDPGTERDLGRVKRQLGIILALGAGALLMAAVSALFGGHALASLTVESATTNHAIEVMQDHEKRITVIESRVKHLIRGLDQVQGEAYDALKRTVAYESYRRFGEVEASTRRIMRGWEKLFAHRLSPELVQADQLDGVMSRLDRLARKHGLEMVSSKKEDLFQFSASHVVTDTGKLIIFVHCPLVPQGGLLQVYRYMPVPIRPPQLDAFIVAQPEEEILAINAAQDSFRALSQRELDACERVKDTYFCRSANFYDKRVQDDCLVGLFRANPGAVHGACALDTHPLRDSLVALNGSAYALFLVHETPLSFNCEGDLRPRRSRAVSGTLLVRVPPRCTVATDSFVMEGVEQLDAPPVVEGLGVAYIGEMLSPDDISAIHHRATTSISAARGRQAVNVKDLRAGFEKERSLWTVSLTLWSVAVLVALLACCGGYAYCRRKLRPQPRRQRYCDYEDEPDGPFRPIYRRLRRRRRDNPSDATIETEMIDRPPNAPPNSPRPPPTATTQQSSQPLPFLDHDFAGANGACSRGCFVCRSGVQTLDQLQDLAEGRSSLMRAPGDAAGPDPAETSYHRKVWEFILHSQRSRQATSGQPSPPETGGQQQPTPSTTSTLPR